MTDRVSPSSKPTANAAPPPAPAAAKPQFPPNKAQQYNAARPVYRPEPPPRRRRHRRGCCCSCCLWTTLLIVVILLLAAIAGAVFYVLYSPHRPSFSVASLHLSKFNLTDTTITSNFNVTLIARNRNSKITFFYDQFSVRLISGDVDVGDGFFPGFTHNRNNVTSLRTTISNSNAPIPDGTDITALKSSFRSKDLPVQIQLETKVKAKIGKVETGKLRIRVLCDGITVAVPTGNTTSVGAISKIKCKVDPRIKILRWTI